MKKGQIFRAKESFPPIYKKGDKFKIIKFNKNSNLMDVEAVRLKDGEVYGFSKEEIESK